MSTRLVPLALIVCALSLWAGACSEAAAPCVCPEAAPAPVEPPLASHDAAAAQPAPAPAPAPIAGGTALPGADQLRPSTPEARMALQLAVDLFSDRAEAVHARFTPALAAEVVVPRIREIVAGVTTAHGVPVQVMDAWFTEIEEDKERLPAAMVLLRMANEQRFRLLLVLTPSGEVNGFWLRPL